MIKKADIVLFILIVVFGGLISWWSLAGSIAGEKVLITADGRDYGVYSLAEDQTIDVTIDGHTNHITIKDGTVSMTYSTCKNQVCVNTGAISQTKDAIVCLPNKVVVEIVGSGKGGAADVISG
ncbi:MAG: NusG domain II-containing protein [Firmicutes bacterium]|nr:NusG domain II-containing protein [Bacillota bacterium]